jgi:putative membrane protein
MLDLLAPFYLWIKATHVVAAMLWLGGQCVLLMLLAAHAEILGRNEDAVHLAEVERRCFAIVVNPAMLATLVLGMTLFLLQGPSLLRETWFQIKLPAVVAMAALHGAIAATHGAMRRDGKAPARGRICRLQVAGLALTAAIVSLAVVK